MIDAKASIQHPADPTVEAIARLSVVPRILDAVVRATGMRFAAVARVTDHRWIACAVRDDLGFGLRPGDDLVLETTICNDIRSHRTPVVFGHASAHPVYAQHHTPRLYGLESYASVPIFSVQGEFIGTLCAIDSRPLPIDERAIAEEMTLYAELISSQMALEDRADNAELALRAEVDAGVLREQFLAVVGHDLRSPLQSATLASETLAEMDLPPRAQRMTGVIQASVRRMAGLIDDIMDFARARLAAGIPMAHLDDEDLADIVHRVVSEVAAAHPQARIVADVDLPSCMRFDPVRMQQLLANLLNNAVAHGDIGQPIRVESHCDASTAIVSVTNFGEPIDPATLDMLFHPFSRPNSSVPRPGLGLGLYIAAEIAKAHDGELSVTSTRAEGTRFILRLPLVVEARRAEG